MALFNKRKPVDIEILAAPSMPSVSARSHALDEEKRQLAAEVAEMTFDLGGLVYEMAIRDHFKTDVLAHRAAQLQLADARLSEIERLISDNSGIGGNCRFCGSPHGRSAEFCWNCGERLIDRISFSDPLLRENTVFLVPDGESGSSDTAITAEHEAIQGRIALTRR